MAAQATTNNNDKNAGLVKLLMFAANVAVAEAEPVWTGAGELELKKIPFFVRGKARRTTERFARERGLAQITVETLYEAKAHFGR